MTPFPIPVVALGPGSQPETESLNYLAMPSGMHTYRAPILPEPEATGDLEPARLVLRALLGLLAGYRPDGFSVSAPLEVASLDAANRRLLDQVLGEGEVSAQVATDAGGVHIQESVFAGVWRVRADDGEGRLIADSIEVGDIPGVVRQTPGSAPARASPPVGPGVINAPALLAEIRDRLEHGVLGEPHVINLSLLPFSPEDAVWLDAALGRGRVTILSRGYGNCRITATGMTGVWWVQFFNSQDALILNTLEVTPVPTVARAAPEDIEDSRERLAEVLDWID